MKHYFFEYKTPHQLKEKRSPPSGTFFKLLRANRGYNLARLLGLLAKKLSQPL